MLTVKQAAERLRVSTALIYALCAGGKIVYERYGLGRGTIRISDEDLEAYRRAARVEHPVSTPVVLKHLTMPPSPRGPSRSVAEGGPAAPGASSSDA
jgi:excisionase family DNA binding protein